MSEVKKTLYFTKGMAIKHGDTLYPEGELIELSDEEAKPLKRWIEPAKAEPKAPSGGAKNATKSETKAGSAGTDATANATEKKDEQQ